MCELQFIKKKNCQLLNKYDIEQFILMLKFGSLSNNDAYGLFNGSYTFKKNGFIDTSLIDKSQLKKDCFIIGHNRYKTQGSHKINDNNHPFILNDFMLVHNGIITNYTELKTKYKLKSDIETDSYIILYLIDKFFKECKIKNRIDAIYQSIKKTCNLLEGSFSVFLYDKTGNNSFYFKNSSTNFYFYRSENYLIGSTDDTKLNYLYEGKETLREISIKDNKVYLIKNDLQLIKLGKFKSKKTTYGTYGSGYSDDDYENSRSLAEYNKFGDWENYARDLNNRTEDKNEIQIRQDLDLLLNDICGYTPDYDIIDKKIVKIYDEHFDLLTIFGGSGYYDYNQKTLSINLNDLYEFVS